MLLEISMSDCLILASMNYLVLLKYIKIVFLNYHLPMYKIDCNDYDVFYVGQTNRRLQTRISEHRNYICRNMSTHSVITDHRSDLNHNFKWNDVEILDNESHLNKRLISFHKKTKEQFEFTDEYGMLTSTILKISRTFVISKMFVHNVSDLPSLGKYFKMC